MRVLLACVIGFWATGVFAHSPLSATTPTDKSVVAMVPKEIVLDFKGKIRLTRVRVVHSEQSSVDLELGGFKGFLSEYAIPMQAMGRGSYAVEWRGLGADGHAMKGAFGFEVE